MKMKHILEKSEISTAFTLGQQTFSERAFQSTETIWKQMVHCEWSRFLEKSYNSGPFALRNKRFRDVVSKVQKPYENKRFSHFGNRVQKTIFA